MDEKIKFWSVLNLVGVLAGFPLILLHLAVGNIDTALSNEQEKYLAVFFIGIIVSVISLFYAKFKSSTPERTLLFLRLPFYYLFLAISLYFITMVIFIN